MKNIIFALAFVALLAAVGYGQKLTVEQTLMKMEEEMAADILTGKTTAFEKYAAENAVFTDPGGMTLTKAQLIALFKSGDLKFESSKIDDSKVTVHGSTAIVTYRTTDKGVLKGQDISGQYRWTDVFVKTNGKWLLVAGQGTPIMQMPK